MPKKKAMYQLVRDYKIVSMLRKEATGSAAVKLDKWLARIMEAARPGNHTNEPDPKFAEFNAKIARNKKKFGAFIESQKELLKEEEVKV